MLARDWLACRVFPGPCPAPGDAALHDRGGRERNDQRACLDLQPLCRIIAMASAPASTNAVAVAAASAHLASLGLGFGGDQDRTGVALPLPSAV